LERGQGRGFPQRRGSGRCMGGLGTTPPVPPALYLSAFQKIDGRRGGVF